MDAFANDEGVELYLEHVTEVMQMTLRSLCASRGRLRRKLRHLVDHGGGLHQVSLSGKAIVIKPRLANTLGEKQMRVLYNVLYNYIAYYTTYFTQHIILRIRIGQP